MKNLKKVLLLLILNALSISVMALDYIVSDAGSTAVNGTYVEDGTYNEMPSYHMEGTSYYIRYSYGKWYIMFGEYNYFYTTNVNGETPPSTGWELSYNGSEPAPSVEADAALLSYSSLVFDESSNNDGSISNSITISLNNYNGITFTGNNNDDFVSDGKIVVTNLSGGLTAVITRTSSLELSASLTGNALAHNNINDVSNLTFTFQDGAFSTGNASSVVNYDKDNLEINFVQEYIVNPLEGEGDFTTIAAALAAAGNGDIINISAGTYTESGLEINKELTLMGAGIGSTIVQAHSTEGSATDRVFHITDGTVLMKNMTIRHGVTEDVGGGIYNESGADLTIKYVLICNNQARYGGGIRNRGEINVDKCTISNNKTYHSNSSYGVGGAGMDHYYTSIPGSIVQNSTFSGNANSLTNSSTYTAGGGLRCDSELTISNCTFFGNTTPYESTQAGGGAIFLTHVNDDDESVEIIDCTIANNSSGLANYQSNFSIENTILVDNTNYDYNSTQGIDYYFYITDNGHNIVENQNRGDYSYKVFFNQTTDILYSHNYLGKEEGASGLGWNKNNTSIDGSPNLSSSLADNTNNYGTQTLALLLGSFAIDNGTGSGMDQRGISVYNSVKDIGAYEYNPAYVSWYGETSSNWNTSTNWNTGVIPSSSGVFRKVCQLLALQRPGALAEGRCRANISNYK